jgi:ATP-dependent Clp protease ATP-binding subunit ClpX
VYHQVVSWTEHVSCRSAGDCSESDSCTSDTDMVELEKSNILVMGPTGSGTCSDPRVT